MGLNSSAQCQHFFKCPILKSDLTKFDQSTHEKIRKTWIACTEFLATVYRWAPDGYLPDGFEIQAPLLANIDQITGSSIENGLEELTSIAILESLKRFLSKLIDGEIEIADNNREEIMLLLKALSQITPTPGNALENYDIMKKFWSTIPKRPCLMEQTQDDYSESESTVGYYSPGMAPIECHKRLPARTDFGSPVIDGQPI